MNRKLAMTVLIGLVLVAVPLAGCIGGEGGSATPSDVDSDVADESDLTNSSDAGDRAHVHNRWFDESGNPTETVTVVDRTVTIDPIDTERDKPVQQCRQVPRDGPTACFGQKTFYPQTGEETGKIVPPGTKNVEVTLDWDSGFDQIRFYYRHAMSTSTWENLGTFESGDTMTIAPIPVEKADDGHARVSAWQFHIEPKGNPYPAGDQVWYGEGDVDVTVEANRQNGDLPVEPPHPDFWEETDTYRIGHVAGSANSFTHAGPAHAEQNTCGVGIGSVCTPLSLNSEGLFWTIQPGYEGRRLTSAEPAQELTGEHDRALVPPDTAIVAAQIDIQGSANQPVEVCFRTVSSPSEGPYGIPTECTTYQGGGQTMTVTQPISPRLADSVYADNTGQNASRWSFLVQVSAPDTATTNALGSFDGEIEASIFTTKAGEFALPAWAEIGGGSQ